jgi:hypothetical protein
VSRRVPNHMMRLPQTHFCTPVLPENYIRAGRADLLKAASTKAAETIAAACPRELPNSPVGRLEVMEKRLAAMLEGVKTVRPAFEAFLRLRFRKSPKT